MEIAVQLVLSIYWTKCIKYGQKNCFCCLYWGKVCLCSSNTFGDTSKSVQVNCVLVLIFYVIRHISYKVMSISQPMCMKFCKIELFWWPCWGKKCLSGSNTFWNTTSEGATKNVQLFYKRLFFFKKKQYFHFPPQKYFDYLIKWLTHFKVINQNSQKFHSYQKGKFLFVS